ncbi:MAG: hypothetical protein RLZZ312_1275 [Bacteroidota bacterium]|jgi:MFS family permease
MNIFNFKKWNTIVGWTVFGIALAVFSLTVEPTMSFWDCGEYIATSAKLEVGHPPGAPLFQMMGAFFAMFAPSATHIALMVNMMSVFSSAFTVLFLFWSATILLKNLISKDKELDKTHAIAVLGSAAVGALAFTFSDSFWYNAVEAEVYAMATLLISLLFWLGLRWEQDMHTPRGNRWVLIISLVVGLSFGVHFMALLTIPSIGLLYFFKHYKTITIKNFVIANIVVVAVLLFIFKLLLPLTMALFGKTEIFMVNSIGLPFDSGTVFVALLLIAFFYFGLKYTHDQGFVQLNTLILCVLFILVGFSTWMMLPIRANANTVINENKPSDAAEVLAYYNREQYGVNPLFYGPQFSDTYSGLDSIQPYVDKAPNYERNYETGKYEITNNYLNAEQNGNEAHKTFMPRMWSSEHAENYMTFSNPLDFSINPEYNEEPELIKIISEFRKAVVSGQVDMEGYAKFLKTYKDYLIIKKPSNFDNFKFMFEYQFGYMYWRYLMWNFVGRQNDEQGKYDLQNGNWISGITPIDELHVGSQQNLPSDVLKNKGRNTYYFLPFILGILGLLFHLKKDKNSFYVVMVLFLFTGLALKVYLNERPFEPRERDYALVGSFYVFGIWIALGVYAIFDYLKKWLSPKISAPVVIGVCVLAAPVLMAFQNWDDHDRSGKYTATAMAKNYLNACEPNAILFTIGDNDTFPLWYCQEIEGIRTDVRIVNTSLFMMDWYIEQMKAKAYESEPMPISFTYDQFNGDKLDFSVFTNKTEERWNIKDFINFLKLKDDRATYTLDSGIKIQTCLTNKIKIPVDKNVVIANKVVNSKYNDSIVSSIDIDIKGQALYKNRLMMLDIIANNNWKRPIYFSPGSFDDEDYIWMKDYLQLDGIIYKLVPIKNLVSKQTAMLDMGQIDTDVMYKNVMAWNWGNGESTKIYHDPETRRNAISYRTNMARLVEQLIKENKIDKAKKVLDLGIAKMPLEQYEFYTMLEPFVSGYYDVKEPSKAQKLVGQLFKKYQESLNYYNGLKTTEQNQMQSEILMNLYRYEALIDIVSDKDQTNFALQSRKDYAKYKSMFVRLIPEE